MQMLWAAELQARQFGVCGSDPFNPSQLPLLATMQFDGTQKGEGPKLLPIYTLLHIEYAS